MQHLSLHCRYLVFRFRLLFLFAEKPDGTRGSELAVQLRIAALQALFAQVDIMLHAQVAGFTVGVVDAFSHKCSL